MKSKLTSGEWKTVGVHVESEVHAHYGHGCFELDCLLLLSTSDPDVCCCVVRLMFIMYIIFICCVFEPEGMTFCDPSSHV